MDTKGGILHALAFAEAKEKYYQRVYISERGFFLFLNEFKKAER